MYYDGGNGIPTANPGNGQEFYQYMKSVWLDGTHLTYGGNGYPGSAGNTGQLTNFIYNGTPYGSGWTEASNGNTPSDRRFLLSSGPITLPSGGETTIDFAYVFTWDSLAPNGLATSIARNSADLERVQRWFDTDSFPSCEVYTVGVGDDAAPVKNSLQVYPNPSSEWVYIKVYKVTPGMMLEITDISGKLVYRQNFTEEYIDVSYLDNGIYTLKLLTPGEVLTAKFVRD
jgi:hypothetical protein